MAEHFLYVVAEAGQDRPVALGASRDPAKHLRQFQAGNPRPLLIRGAYRIFAASPARHAAELALAVRQIFPGLRAPWCPASVGEADEAVRRLSRHLVRPQQGRLVGAKRGFEAFAADDLPDRFQFSTVAEGEVARWQEQAERDGPLDAGPMPRLGAEGRMAVDAAVEAVTRETRRQAIS